VPSLVEIGLEVFQQDLCRVINFVKHKQVRPLYRVLTFACKKRKHTRKRSGIINYITHIFYISIKYLFDR
jgi:hypothetical protein